MKKPMESAVENPTPSTSSGQALRKEREGWGTRTEWATQHSFDPEYTQGARNAVRVCLRVQPSEKVCVITDEVTLEIAAAIVHELDELGAPYHVWVLGVLAGGPL